MPCRQRTIKPRGEPSPPSGKPRLPILRQAAHPSPLVLQGVPRVVRHVRRHPIVRLYPEMRRVPQSLTEETAAARTLARLATIDNTECP
jgi:hypothetical protein